MADDPQCQTVEITSNEDVPRPIAEGAAPNGRLLGRAAAARLLGVSKSTLRRMEGEKLEPVLGPKNVHLFHEEQVQALVMTRRTSVGDTQAIGDVAANAFQLFDENVHPVDVIKQLRIAPNVIDSLHQQWARLRGLLVVSPDMTEAISNMLRDGQAGPLPKTDAELLDLAKAWVYDASPRTCVQCKHEVADFCRACGKAWGLRAARGELGQRRANRL